MSDLPVRRKRNMRGHEEFKELIEDVLSQEPEPGKSYRLMLTERMAQRALSLDEPRAYAYYEILMKNRYGDAPKELSRMEMLEKLMDSFGDDSMRAKFAQMMLGEVETELGEQLSVPPKIVKWDEHLEVKEEDLPCLIEKGVDSIRIDTFEAMKAFNFGQDLVRNQLGKLEEKVKLIQQAVPSA